MRWKELSLILINCLVRNYWIVCYLVIHTVTHPEVRNVFSLFISDVPEGYLERFFCLDWYISNVSETSWSLLVWFHFCLGFPLSIPELSWEQLKSFHASHYHPSNSRIFTYGDIPLETHLSTLDSYLEKFQFLDMNTSVPQESRFVFYVTDPIIYLVFDLLLGIFFLECFLNTKIPVIFAWNR